MIAGFGDIGGRVARRLVQRGWQVTAIIRTPQKRIAAECSSAVPRTLDLDHPEDIGDADILFWFAPPRAEGVRDERLRAFLDAQRGRIGRVVYISTSGVYGDCAGRWIDEEEPLNPQTDRARRRADAESALADWSRRSAAEIVVLRVPGIYGPGRLPRQRLERGLPVLRPDQSPCSNRIHADDLAAVAVLAAERGGAGRAYNVADGNPTTMADYFLRCARLLGLPPPRELDLDAARRELSAAMWSFIEESKRLRIDRARDELGFAPRYPDLESGLPSCLEP